MNLKSALDYFNYIYEEGHISEKRANELMDMKYTDFIREIKVMMERGDYEANRQVEEAREFYNEN